MGCGRYCAKVEIGQNVLYHYFNAWSNVASEILTFRANVAHKWDVLTPWLTPKLLINQKLLFFCTFRFVLNVAWVYKWGYILTFSGRIPYVVNWPFCRIS